jgi:hypothetical protein
MGWIENRVSAAESRIEYLCRLIQDLNAQIKAAMQAARQAASNYPYVSVGYGQAFYTATPTSSVSAATYSGTAPTAGVTFTATVYQWNGGTPTSIGSQTCFNTLPVSLTADAPCPVAPDGNGNYGVLSQSCATV